MSHRNTPIALNEYYHLYSRGVDKRKIFLDAADRKRFIRLLYLCNGSKPVVYREARKRQLSEIDTGEKLVAIGAYCLMPNHFHLLVRETSEGGTVFFMRKLLTAYSGYFNKKYERNGALFSSEFKSSYLDTDEYLKYIFAYIHLNPLKIRDPKWRERGIDQKSASRFLEGYGSSSLVDYQGKWRDELLILNKSAFPDYFPNPTDFESYIYDWLKYDPQIYRGETSV